MLRCTCDARPASTAICIMLVSNWVCSSCCCPTSAGKVVLEKWIIILFSVFLLCQSQSVELGRKGVKGGSQANSLSWGTRTLLQCCTTSKAGVTTQKPRCKWEATDCTKWRRWDHGLNWRCNVRRGVAFNKLIYIYPPLMEKMERKIQEQEKGAKVHSDKLYTNCYNICYNSETRCILSLKPLQKFGKLVN